MIQVLLLYLLELQRLYFSVPSESVEPKQILLIADSERYGRELGGFRIAKIAHIVHLSIHIEGTAQQIKILHQT